MRHIYFFKFYSRIGLTTKPHGQKELNIGVEDGLDAILSKSFLKKFSQAKVYSFSFPKPEEIKREAIIDTIISSSIQAKEFIEKEMKTSRLRSKNKSIQVVIGGDHSITFPSFLAVLGRVKDVKKIGYIQIDSHGDMNLYKDSPTKNWHGMYVRPFLDTFDIPKIDKLVRHKLSLKNVWFFGNLDLDPFEKKFFKKSKIKNTTPKDIVKNNLFVEKKFRAFCETFDHLHVSIDIDAFDKTIAPATGIPAEHGFFWRQIKPFFQLFAKQKSISIDLAEVNPKKKGAKKTIQLAQKILKTLLL